MSILWSRPSYSQVQLGRTDWVVWVCAGFPNWNMKWRNAIDTCPKTVKFINFYLKFVSLFLTFRHLKFLAVFSWSYTRHNGTLFFNCKDACPGGGGVLPIKAYTGRLSPKGVHFSGFRYMKGKGFYSLKYIRGQGNLSFQSVKGPKWLTDEFCGCIKSRKLSIFVIDSYLNDSAFTAVKRDAKF